ncbi:Hydantoinase/oxoprolinase N-terminal region-domain-containing protein [Pavlovales sp. CCMP2436]|nr:Hydantoinase/oxoprolinase N-terminal region-domain-containing protein [Pavlovales sp. CCMP2436]
MADPTSEPPGRAGLFRFCIDRGGTFTDVYAEVPVPPGHVVLKLLSEDPGSYADAPTEGIRRVLERVTGVPHPRGQPIDASRIEWIRMGTTVATNALLEREGERVALATTAGFADLLEIGTQARPAIFDLRVSTPSNLYETVIEIDERVRVLRKGEAPASAASTVVVGPTGERVEV